MPKAGIEKDVLIVSSFVLSSQRASLIFELARSLGRLTKVFSPAKLLIVLHSSMRGQVYTTSSTCALDKTPGTLNLKMQPPPQSSLHIFKFPSSYGMGV